ncbi:MAG: hypothetical protein WBL27_13020 [Salinimicrobium sp.]
MILRKWVFRSCFLLIGVLPTWSFAQEKDCACCDTSYSDFDFWVGEWIVKNSKGEIVGKNTIRKLEDNCLISETWTGVNDSSGRSYNYYDRKKATWNQLWISNTGNVLKLEGKLENGKMVLTGPVESGAKGTYRNQIIWTPKNDGTVTQEWVIMTNEDKDKERLFYGIYYPVKDELEIKE